MPGAAQVARQHLTLPQPKNHVWTTHCRIEKALARLLRHRPENQQPQNRHEEQTSMRTYLDMIGEVLRFGTRKENRTGVDTISTFNHNYELVWDESMIRSEERTKAMRGLIHTEQQVLAPNQVPLLTTKEISWKNILVELLWFLSGDTHVGFLRRHHCGFWEPWVDEDGRVPSAYGNFWRHFPVHDVVGDGSIQSIQGPTCRWNDQLAWVVGELRRNPMSRRCVMTAWAPENAQHSKLPPCHFAVYFNVQLNRSGEPRLCLHLTQRSCDLALGVPYNMASYGLLLLIMARLIGVEPGIFAHTLCDLHIYTSKPDGSMAEHDHVPSLLEQLTRDPRPLPFVTIDPSMKELSDIEALLHPTITTKEILAAFELSGYEPYPALPFKVAV